MVFGGYNNNQNYLSTTEMFVNNAWKIIHEAPLPIPMMNLRGVNLQNEVFSVGRITLYINCATFLINSSLYKGGEQSGGSYTNAIFKFDPANRRWIGAGYMTHPRCCFGIEAVPDIQRYCPVIRFPITSIPWG